MIRIVKTLATKPYKLTPFVRPYLNFCSQKDKDPMQKQDKQKLPGFSISDLASYVQSKGEKFYENLKQKQPFTWIGLTSFSILLYFLLQTDEDEIYPINYFEQEVNMVTKNQMENTVSTPRAGFEDLTVIIAVQPDNLSYKIKFRRERKTYIVDYRDHTERFKKIQTVLDNNPLTFKHKYQYAPNEKIRTYKLYIFFHILSTIFITAYFLRSSPSNVKKAAKKDSTGDLASLMTKKKFQVINQTKVRFKDVAGLDESKIEVQQFVDFLKNPQKYKKLGARIPKGVLLSGPPGTGKTMLAKACAGEAGVPFIATSGSDFVEIFVGVGASRVRDLFSLAKEKAPSIIFIDQIDAVGRKRSQGHSSHDERDNTLNQILVQMDGFETNNNVIIMAATNRLNLLDPALIRPGRFDRNVEVNLPDLEGRRQIFNVHLTKIKLQSSRTQDEYARRLATLTPGFSGAQIANLCNQAAILAARNGKQSVDSHDIQMATERIIGGIERKNIVSKQEKKIVSVHQSGHATVSWFLKGADPLLKLTIIPRSKGSLGFAQYFVDETKLHTKSQLIDRICFILGGRCAEQHFFGKVTNGASDDLKKAYELAHNLVVKLGMNQQIGYIGYKDTEFLRPYSDSIGQKIDKQIRKVLAQCTQITRRMVREHQQHIKNLSEQLFEKETLTIKQIRRILGERDFTSNDTYEKYLQIEKQLEQGHGKIQQIS